MRVVRQVLGAGCRSWLSMGCWLHRFQSPLLSSCRRKWWGLSGKALVVSASSLMLAKWLRQGGRERKEASVRMVYENWNNLCLWHRRLFILPWLLKKGGLRFKLKPLQSCVLNCLRPVARLLLLAQNTGAEVSLSLQHHQRSSVRTDAV